MYVAGATTVDSFKLHKNKVEWLDGTAALGLAGGGFPPNGSTAQVGVIDERQLLVTLKTDPDPGTVDVVPLHDGAVTGGAPVAVSAPAGTLTPFGFSVYRDGTAVITLAHSSQDGLFRNGVAGPHSGSLPVIGRENSLPFFPRRHPATAGLRCRSGPQWRKRNGDGRGSPSAG
jgi:hypothetical protein